MPKNHVGRGPTNVRDADVSPAVVADQAPQVVAEDGLGTPALAIQQAPVVDEPAPAAPVVDEPVPAVPVATGDSPGYEGMTLTELRAEAEKLGVPSYGTKAQITERLRDADESIGE